MQGAGHGGASGVPAPVAAAAPLLVVDRVAKSFGVRRVLRDLSATVDAGEVVAVTGPNGSGKSTLLRIVAGLLRPTRGDVSVLGLRTAAERREQVGYAAPDLALYGELTGCENLMFFDAVRTGERAGTRDEYERRLATVGLGGRGDDPVSAYSSGMRQRLRLAFATSRPVPLLLLDEPSLALDTGGVEIVQQIVAAQRARGGATLLATNDPREVALGDRAVAVTG